MGLTAIAQGWDVAGAGRRPAVEMFDVQGNPWIGRFRQLRLDNLSLIIAAVAPRQDFSFGGTRDAAMLAALIAGILAMAYFLSRQIARRFQRVMQALAAESARIGALELDRPVRVPTRLREITVLVDAQERMRLMLRAATSELEQTVATRTRELGDREALLRMILDTVPIGLSMVREGSRPVMIMANAAGARMFGYEPEELSGHPVIDMWARPEDRDDYIARLRQEGPCPASRRACADATAASSGYPSRRR